MRTLWICALLWLLSMAAPGWISVARSGALQAPAAALKVSIAPQPDATNPGANSGADFSGYLYLHATRNQVHAGHGDVPAKQCAQ